MSHNIVKGLQIKDYHILWIRVL